MKFKIFIVTTIFFLNLSGCQLLPEDKQLKSFRVLVQQGNVIDESKVNLLKINMSKEQVIFLLGEPVVNNIFNKNRWDYVYYRKRDPEETQLNMISIFFKEDNVISMKRIAKNDDGLFDVTEKRSLSDPEFLNDEQATIVKKEIFEDIELKGTKINEEEKENLPKISESKEDINSEKTENLYNNKKLKKELDLTTDEEKLSESEQKIKAPVEYNKRKNDNEIVQEIIIKWANSWAKKDLDGYFSYYSEDFKSSYFDDFDLWKTDREKRIKNKENININITKISIDFEIDTLEKAIAIFEQNYDSEGYADTVTKKLIFIKNKNKWQIISEELVKGRY